MGEIPEMKRRRLSKNLYGNQCFADKPRHWEIEKYVRSDGEKRSGMFLEVKLNGKIFFFLVSSRTSKSFITYELASLLELSKEFVDEIIISTPTEEIRSVRVTSVQIEIGHKSIQHSFPIIQNTSPYEVLGLDLINKMKLIFDFEEFKVFSREGKEWIKLTSLLDINEVAKISEKSLKKFLSEMELTEPSVQIPIPFEEENDKKKIVKKSSSIPFYWEENLNKMIENMLKCGIIERSESEWESPIRIENTGVGILRASVDYREVNRLINSQSIHPIDIRNEFHKFHSKNYFSLIIVLKVHRILIKEDHRYKTAFKTSRGKFQFRKLPYGLNYKHINLDKFINDNSPYTFSRNSDSFLVFSSGINSHRKHLERLIRILENFGAIIDVDRSNFFQSEVPWKDFIVNGRGWKIDRRSIEQIYKFPIPSTKVKLEYFLELVCEYRDFVDNLSSMTSPLYRFMRMEIFPEWTEEADENFNKIKKAIKNSPTLSYPTDSSKYILVPVSYDDNIGGKLIQMDDKRELFMGFYSKRITKDEVKLSEIERIVAAAHYGMEYFSSYLLKQKFDIRLISIDIYHFQTIAKGENWMKKFQRFQYRFIDF